VPQLRHFASRIDSREPFQSENRHLDLRRWRKEMTMLMLMMLMMMRVKKLF
jgi:hypothetical protein